jgi:hypothetical protein
VSLPLWFPPVFSHRLPHRAPHAQVREALVPEAAQCTAALHKLNVMAAGSFFKPHKDTPRGADTCFGTLVVALPVFFQGGQLAFSHGGESQSVDWSRRLQHQVSECTCQRAGVRVRSHPTSCAPTTTAGWILPGAFVRPHQRRSSERHRVLCPAAKRIQRASVI